MRKRWIRWGVLAVSLVVLIVIIWSVGAQGLFETLIGLDPRYVTLAVVSYSGVHLAWAIKWYILVKKPLKAAYFPFVLLANLTGNFINITTPSGRMAGEPIRAGAVSRRFKGKFSKVFATAMVDKMGLTIAMILLLIPIIIFAYHEFDMPPLLKYFLIIFFIFWAAVGLASYVIFRGMTRTKAERMGTWVYHVTRFLHRDKGSKREHIVGKIRDGLTDFRQSFKELAKNPLIIIIDVILGITTYAFRFFAAYMFFLAVGAPTNIFIVATAVHISFIIGLISQLPGMVGIGESTQTALYLAMGVDPTKALTVAILTQLNTYLYELGLGYLAMFTMNVEYDVSKRRALDRR